MAEVQKKQLIIIKKTIKGYQKKQDKILEELMILLQSQEVLKYRRLNTELQEIQKKLNPQAVYDEWLQSKCEHPLWYFLENATDQDELIPLWKCKCMYCKKTEIKHTKELKGKVIVKHTDTIIGEKIDVPYPIVREEYLSKTTPQKQLVMQMTKKYNNQANQ